MPTVETPHELTVCVVVRDDAGKLGRLLEALADQSAPAASYDVVVVDATPGGEASGQRVPDGVEVKVVRAERTATRGELLNLGWTSATAPGVAFLAAELVPSSLWVDAVQRALHRGRRLVTGHLFPHPDQVGDSGPLSYLLWATDREVPLVTADHMACLRSDLARVGGWDAGDADPDVADTRLGARLVDSGVELFRARHALAYHDVERVTLTEMVARRRRTRAISAVLDDHPRARARMLVAGTFWQPRHAEAMLAVAGAVLAVRDRRWALLATPWVHERTCLTPRAGGPRRRWVVLPGVFGFDLYDALRTTALRLRPAQPPG